MENDSPSPTSRPSSSAPSSSPLRSSVEYATTENSSVTNLDQEAGVKSWREWNKSRTGQDDPYVSIEALRGFVPRTLSTDSTDGLVKQEEQVLRLALSTHVASSSGTRSAELASRRSMRTIEDRYEKHSKQHMVSSLGYEHTARRMRPDSGSRYIVDIPAADQRQKDHRSEVPQPSEGDKRHRVIELDNYRDTSDKRADQTADSRDYWEVPSGLVGPSPPPDLVSYIKRDDGKSAYMTRRPSYLPPRDSLGVKRTSSYVYTPGGVEKFSPRPPLLRSSPDPYERYR
ncbi:hypothetical protein CKM354_000175200 [Cercospora kikuchii]|uniref:Uncharacterized protein n=1 Tax=Cercospora kikuchii TaxID=84275 RepID=A0A9P3CBJ3_9PEZI|nr:uncharacterized protein CKM354_000175200 [Cercospora kikuchii]GIZ38332.1 hypothetical protein CKM354_000175200 [Cercospora kikuchii]